MKKLHVKLMHPVEQINMVIGRIYKKGMTTTSGVTLRLEIKMRVFAIISIGC